MTRNLSLVILAVGLSLAAVSVSAQPEQPEQPEAGGPFAVGGTSETAILVDTLTGRTWQLVNADGPEEPVWLPIRRIDNSEDAERWRAENAARQQGDRRARLRAMRERLGPNHPDVQRLEQALQIEPSAGDGT